MKINLEYLKRIKELQDTDTDESYKDGLWDIACENCNYLIENKDHDEIIQATYNALIEFYQNIISN